MGIDDELERIAIMLHLSYCSRITTLGIDVNMFDSPSER